MCKVRLESSAQVEMTDQELIRAECVTDVKMPMMALLPPGGLLGGYAGDPGGVNGSWEGACTFVSTPTLALCPVSRTNTGHTAVCPVCQAYKWLNEQ